MSDGWIGYHPERIDALRERTRAAADDLRSMGSDDPAAVAALGVVELASLHLEADWLPLLDRINASTAMISPFGLSRPAGGDELDPLSDAEEEAVAAFMGAGRLSLLPNTPEPPAGASPGEHAVHTFMYGPWSPAVGPAGAIGDALELSRDSARFLLFDERECGGEEATAPGCAIQVAGIVPWGRLIKVVRAVRWLDEGVDAADEVVSSIGPKIANQMESRGWTDQLVDDTIANPTTTVATRDVRHTADGTRMNDPATAYLRDDGSYVVRNDVTGDIVQVSNRNDSGWRAPWD